MSHVVAGFYNPTWMKSAPLGLSLSAALALPLRQKLNKLCPRTNRSTRGWLKSDSERCGERNVTLRRRSLFIGRKQTLTRTRSQSGSWGAWLRGEFQYIRSPYTLLETATLCFQALAASSGTPRCSVTGCRPSAVYQPP